MKFHENPDKGIINIINNTIVYEGGNHSSKPVIINDLEYAYIYTDDRGEAFLFLFDHQQHYIPVVYKGFSAMYSALSAQLGFDDGIFTKYVGSPKMRKQIWRRSRLPDYETLQNQPNDYATGFEIQSPYKQLVTWDTTYEALEKNDNVHIILSPYNQKQAIFKYPVRMGNILLHNFTCYFDNPRKDVPVLGYHAQCYNATSNDGSYNALKAVLVKDIGLGENYGYEREDQKHISFIRNGIRLSICYSYDSEWGFDVGYTSFSVINERIYEQFLMDTEYEEKMEITRYLNLSPTAEIGSDYKLDNHIKYRPQKLNSLGKCIIWIDEKNKVIGFAGEKYAQLYRFHEVLQLNIQNMLPAKGGGAAFLEIVTKDAAYAKTIFTADCNSFDAYQSKIEKLTGKEVIVLPEYYNC